MRTIIAGSREGISYSDIEAAVSAFEALYGAVSVVLSGTAHGADRHGERYAQERSIALEKHPADWHLYGGRAGRVRNARMATLAEALIAVWDGKSRGTAHMIEVAQLRGLKVYVHRVKV